MRYLFLFVIFLLCVRLGFFYFYPLSLKNGQHILFIATLFDNPKVLGNNQEFFLRYGNFWSSKNLEIITTSDKEFSYGQTLQVNGTLKEKLLKNKQTIMTIQNPQIEAGNSGFLPLFGSLRQKIINFCENNFSQPYSGLLVGIIFGVKSDLTDQITRSFRITGLSHIVAASGMNVTLVGGFLIGLFSGLMKRQWAVMLSLGGIFVYVCISGFDASIVRAALMGGIAFSAGLFGRQYTSLYVLFLIASGMLLWDPLLIMDVGFQLSILATAGILVLKPTLFSHNLISDDIGTTLAAQAATLPVILSTFGEYPLLSILANVLVLWTIPLIMTIGGLGILIGLVIEPLGRMIVWLSIPLLWYLVGVISFFSNTNTTVQITNIPVLVIIGYYLLLISLVMFVKKKIN